jgi:hypothetical protein
MDPHRRWFLFSAAAASFVTAGLAGCGAISSNTTNGVTTLTVNVPQLNAWGQAFSNGAMLIAGLPGISATPVGILLGVVSGSVLADLQSLASTAGTATVLTFDSTSVPTAVNSLLNDGKTLLADAKTALGSVGQASLTTANTYIAAIQTLVSLFQAQLIVAPTTAAALKASAPMAETQALKTLKVR